MNKVRPKILKELLSLYSFMDKNNDEHKKVYHESINFAMQGMGENAQFSIAIAVGIFGILSIFVSLDIHTDDEAVQDSF
ncbi:MAG: hypothetical protein M3250_10210 [Thermoproteota archaeon]|nr:hypothetical protein [Thermoproteota archaeon]